MKTTIASVICLIVGISVGWYLGYVQPNNRANREAMRQFALMDADDSLSATIAVRAISLIDAGEKQKAVESLVWPIGMYYRDHKSRPATQKSSEFLTQIEKLAATNKVVANEIKRKIEHLDNRPAK